MIKPTVGRVIWYYPEKHENLHVNGKEPLAAMIAMVHDDRSINIGGFTADGSVFSRTSVKLVQEGDDQPVDESHATWMPYQVGQAKKEAEAKPGLSPDGAKRADPEAKQSQSVGQPRPSTPFAGGGFHGKT